MNNFILLILLLLFFQTGLRSQNVGIGTNTPQRKLHVSGGVRIDTLAGSGNGIIKFNTSGDLIKFSESGNTADVLRGNGTWGAAVGTVPAGTIVSTYNYNDVNLVSSGFSLIGEYPGISGYYSVSDSSFTKWSWAPTYVKGITSKLSAPALDNIRPVAWTGSELYVFSSGKLDAYNPITDTWSFVSTNPIAINNFSFGRKAVWTGSNFIVWGGHFLTATDNGVRYNHGTITWNTIATLNQPSARINFTMIWTGNRVIIWGGQNSSGTILNDGGIYNPGTDTWVPINGGEADAPEPRTYHTAVWSNVTKQMIIWGGYGGYNEVSPFYLNTGALFNPETNTWAGTANTGAPTARISHTAVWTGTEMIVFGGTYNSGVALNTGSKYNPSSNSWLPTNTTGAPTVGDHAATWTGSYILVTGGNNGPAHYTSSFSYDPVSNTWSYRGLFSNYDNKGSHASFLAGTLVLIWGGNNYADITSQPTPTNTGYRFFLSNTVSDASYINPNQTLYLYRKN